MKKITTTIFALLMTVMVFAQVTRTLQAVSYRGAFEPGVTAWTSGWTEFSPNSPAYTSSKNGATAVAVTKAITASTTWLNTKVYTLTGPIYVKNGATLTIQAGTIIKGNSSVSNSALIIERGSKIIAQGTAADPIIFTSDKVASNRNIGDWGGVILLGKAKINPAGGVTNIEGLAASLDNEFGGTDDNDNSGIMTYCRIEFAGYIFAPDKEINGLTFGAVGRGTTINHIQVSYSNDDSYEWFGGTVNATHLVAYRGLDDDFDTDFGYSGTLQFCLSIRDKNISDQSSGSTSESFESDNEGTGTDSTITPKTKAILSNFTVVGPYRGDATFNETVSTGAFKFRRAMRIRRNSSLRVFNSVFTDFQNGIFIDGDLCVKNATRDAASSNALAVKSNVFANMKNGATVEANAKWGTTFLGVTAPTAAAWFAANNNSYQASSNGLFVDNISSSNILTADLRPASGSALESGADFTTDFIAERTRLGLGVADITIDTLEIANISDVATKTINVSSILNADSYVWSTSAKSGVTFVTGQGTTAITVSFATNLASTSAKPAYIYCKAFNIASNVYSTTDSVKITRTKPTFKIAALTSNAANGVLVGAASVTCVGTSASAQKTVTVASTTGLSVGMFVKVVPGTTAGNAGTNNTVASIVDATHFTLTNNITTSLTAGGVLRAYIVPQNSFAPVTCTAGSSVGTLVTVTSTIGLVEGMWIRISAGTGTLKANTIIAKIVDGTNFIVSLAPTVALSGATIIAYPLIQNTCSVPLVDAGANTSEFDISVVATPSNNIGYRFDVPVGVRIVRAGANPNNDYLTNRVATVSTTASNIGVVFDAAFVSGSIKVTPYNNAGLGTAFSIKVVKEKAGVWKVTSSAAAVKNTTVVYKAYATNGSAVTSYKWTLPTTNVTALSGSISGNIVTTTTDTLSISFDSTSKTAYFKAGSLKVELINNCGTGVAKSFTLNGTTTLAKTSGETDLQEIAEEVTNATSFNVYPNPNNGNFNVSMISDNTEEVAQVTIINVVGQVVSSITIPNNNGVINSEINANLSTGIYFVKVQLGSEVSVAKISVN
ncbi:MAG: T9SS type A sorting domain-containing protein [Bacteroidia bacterium]